MMKTLYTIAALTLSFTTFAASSGYIIKFKNSANLQSFTQTLVKTSIGIFAKVTSKELNFIPSEAVEYIEPNFIFNAFAIDPKFSKQWALQNTGKNSNTWPLKANPGEDINALEAWKISTGSKEIKIAIIDTGVDYKHEDLKNNILINHSEKNGEPGVDDDGNGHIDDIYGYNFSGDNSDPMDDHNHGTHCAGIIGASHNKIGIRGVMNNVKILPIKYLSKTGRGDTLNAIKSIQYAMDRGVNIMSNSWGGGDFSQSLKDIIEEAGRRGIIFIAAAGNAKYGYDIDKSKMYPASYKLENIITVGALNSFGNRALFSNYGKKSVHVFAPGKKILSTVRNNKYKKMDGTSMAAPMVAGIVGLLMSVSPELTPLEIRQKIIKTAIRQPLLDPLTVSGRIDAFELLK